MNLKELNFYLNVFLLIISTSKLCQAFESKATHAILIDAQTKQVLYQKQADEPMAPSSMSKLMTIYMVFEQLALGNIKLDDELVVSEHAWRKAGSKMFIKLGTKVKIEDLLLGVIVQSGNDASICLAEGLAGSEESFAQNMNKKAQELGLLASNFINSTGWPADHHHMSSRDLSQLAQKLIEDFPQYYHYFSIKEFTYNNIRQENRNMLLNLLNGIDGLKTGHTEKAGYGITASLNKDNRRLILVINGLSKATERAQEATKLFQYGMLNYENIKVINKDTPLEDLPIWLGDQLTIPLMVDHDIIMTVARAERKKINVKLEYNSPLIAPIAVNQLIANIIVEHPDHSTINYPIYAKKEVKKLGLIRSMITKTKFEINRLLN